MTFTDHFSVVDGSISPQPWTQLRQVASKETVSVSKSYDPNDGVPKNDLLQSVSVQWTNTSPISQYVYGMVTKSGSQVTLQSRSRGYLSTSHGARYGAVVTPISMGEVSRFGVGTDLGAGGILGLGGAFGISELRQNSTTVPLMPQITGWALLLPGETFAGSVEVRFVSDYWENTGIDGGDADTESKVITGDLRVDLFAVPAFASPGARSTPYIVGGASNVKSNVQVTNSVNIAKPTGLVAGDILIAVVANQLGMDYDIQPVQTGWALLHSRNEGLAGMADVHLKIFIRTVTGSEPSTFQFTNSLLAEEIGILFALRDSVPHDSAEGLGWYVASNLSRFTLFEEHVAPSIAQSGQFLIAINYFAHTPLQGAITQTPPTGMTEIIDVAASGTSLSIATLASPPNPTLTRQFTPSALPLFSGHAISAAILAPGKR